MTDSSAKKSQPNLTQTQEIAFIAPNITDYLQLAQGVRQDVEAIVLDSQSDAVEQITEILSQRQGIKVIHLISHGTSGKIALGNSILSKETISSYAPQLMQWAKTLTPDATLLIYGCEVAQGKEGRTLIHLLSELTGLHIAASTTKIGASVLGGNWQLDTTTSPLTVQLALLPVVMENYQGVFVSGDEFLVNTYTTSDQLYSSVTALNDGGFVVTWSSLGQDGGGYGVYGQRYNALGVAVGSEFRVNTFTNSDQKYSSVTTLSDGGFVVTWSSSLQEGRNYGIYGQRYNALGVAVGNEFRVNTYTMSEQLYSSVTTLSDGGFVVTWSSSGQDGSFYGIYGQRYNALGATVGNEFKVNTYTISDQQNSSVTALNDGGFVVTWSSSGQDGSGSGIYGQRYNALGYAVGDEFRVNTYTTSNQLYSSVTALGDGGFVVTWSSLDQDGNDFGIYGQRYDASGATVGSEFQINTYTTSSQIYSSVTALGDGGFVVTWSSLGQDGNSYGIYGQRFSADGALRGSEFRINQTTAGSQLSDTRNNGTYTIDTLANGQVIATWEGNGSGDTSGVYARILDFDYDPTNITLSNNNIAENQVNALIGSLSTSDLNQDDTHTYSIVSGFGNDTAFSISGDQLYTNGSFDYETQNTYTVRIRTTDPTGASYEKDLTINVTDVNENSAPVVTNPVTATATEDDAAFTVNLLTDASDPDAGTTLNVSNLTLTGGNAAGITISGNTLDVNPNAYNSLNVGQSSIITYSYDVTDGSFSVPQTATITINGVNDAATITGTLSTSVTEDDSDPNLTATGNLTISDPDTGEDQFSTNVTGSGNLGSLSITSDGAYTYTVVNSAVQYLGAGGTKTETFTVSSVDGTTQDITITINGLDDNLSPVALDNTATAVVNFPINISVSTLLSNDTDADGDVLSITSISNITGGTATLNDNGTLLDKTDDFITYTPSSVGNFSLDYTVDDGNGGNDIGTVQITVLRELLGTSSRDTLSGSNSDDIIKALAGRDLVYGNSGNDRIEGGLGNDTIYGGDGDDFIQAGDGDDLLYGNAGNDTIYGGNGQDTSYGGDGNDLLFGQLGNNILVGGGGSDTLYGGSQVNQIVYQQISDRGTAITGDQIKQFDTSQDKLILTELFDNIGYSGSNPVADGYLRLRLSGSSTLLEIDADGGANSFVRMATLYNVTASNLDIDTNVII
ncbi:hypothetical protein C7H19_21635 [Aphanothece hegewaldii CCALA 016]|uniref:Cadherin domain-containing protein n=1 Tax=Aphanothece hegewaldii CCALA 016 TaxID=2107694 RepID=A0A2T1LSB5_9CHRO|nr:DUF4347 domain-containing protein [Aphanothece hegewaldii]PSF32497.1 hypothetical protein C7H19_21635 [Aphanothece hegewaldii CCALA 016]